jgi:hypothetical protein
VNTETQQGIEQLKMRLPKRFSNLAAQIRHLADERWTWKSDLRADLDMVDHIESRLEDMLHQVSNLRKQAYELLDAEEASNG